MATAALCLLVPLADSAYAQSPPEGTGDRQAVHPCQAEPDDKPADETDKIGPDQNGNEQAGKLDRCNGVLVPPQTGDRELEEAPPDTGTTPVIPPGGVPQQPQPQ